MVVGMYPCILRRITAAVTTNDGDAGRDRFAVNIDDPEFEFKHRHTIFPVLCFQGRLAATDKILDLNCRIAAFIGDVGNLAAVRRPPRCRDVEVAVGQRKRFCNAVNVSDPELMPLPAQIRRIGNSAAVRGNVRACVP